MTNPEDLIGKKSKHDEDNNTNNNNDKNKSSTAYTIRYSSNDLLAEAVLIAGQPKFLVVARNSGSIYIESSINVEGKILKPLKKEAYLSRPYSFSSNDQAYEYESEARHITQSDLYTEMRSLCQLFIVGDNNHISLLTADITYTYYQDRLGLTHYLFFIGKPGSGKSNNLTMIKMLGYRTFMNADMTPANIYQFLGNQEEAIGTLCIDEANSIDENNKLMEIYKTGYITGNKVARTDTHNGRVQNAYYTFCYKAFAGERLPDAVTANGFNERLIPINCYDGNPNYDIAEIISPAGEQEYQQLLDKIEHTRNLLFIHRLIHWFESIPTVVTKLRSRERQLFVSLIKMYHRESVWPEIKSAISYYIFERRQRQLDTLHAYLYGLIKRLVKQNNSFELKSSDIWNQLKDELIGNPIPSKPLSYDTEKYGTISQSQITKVATEVFGAKKSSRHGNANRLIFDKEKFARAGMTYEISIDSVDSGILGIDGIDDSTCGMDAYVKNNHDKATNTEVRNASIDSAGSEVKQDEITTGDSGILGIDGIDKDDLRDNPDINSPEAEDFKTQGSDDMNNKESGVNQSIGIVGDDGIDIIDKDVHNGDGDYTDDSKDLDSDISITDLSSMDHHNSNSHVSKSNQSLSLSNSQIRRAALTAANATATTNLSQVSQVSQPTMEAITQFFYDEPYLPYHPPSPHELEDSPCKSIIRFDSHSSLYNCALHPDVQSYHLESIEHHIKFKNPDMHKSEILKQLIAYVSEDELES
jgi:hypothetical protein